MLSIVLDTSKILEWRDRNNLKVEFKKLFENGENVYIPFEVLKELAKKMDEDKRLEFEELINDGTSKKIIVKSRREYKLDRNFKKLTSQLKTLHLNLSRTDRIVIALAGQTKSRVETNDTGIIRALSWLKASPNPWQHVFLQLSPRNVDDEYND